MPYFVSALIAALVVSSISVIVILSIYWNMRKQDRRLLYFLSLSAGGMLGGALFHLLPEAIEGVGGESLPVFIVTVIGFSFFFLIERVLHLHHVHHHDQHHEHHHQHLGAMNLLGDGIHNFLDGIVIVTAFSLDVSLGIAVTIAVVMHEIPQEIGDFGVLLYAGYSRSKALAYNFFIALLAILGVIVGFALLSTSTEVEHILVPFAAGSFLYIAATDLLPEIHKEHTVSRAFISYLVFIAALVAMYILKILFE